METARLNAALIMLDDAQHLASAVARFEEAALDQCFAASAAIEDEMEVYILPRVRLGHT